jgi:hypothetical protein
MIVSGGENVYPYPASGASPGEDELMIGYARVRLGGFKLAKSVDSPRRCRARRVESC